VTNEFFLLAKLIKNLICNCDQLNNPSVVFPSLTKYNCSYCYNLAETYHWEIFGILLLKFIIIVEIEVHLVSFI